MLNHRLISLQTSTGRSGLIGKHRKSYFVKYSTTTTTVVVHFRFTTLENKPAARGEADISLGERNIRSEVREEC